jgi:hypothetical protein
MRCHRRGKRACGDAPAVLLPLVRCGGASFGNGLLLRARLFVKARACARRAFAVSRSGPWHRGIVGDDRCRIDILAWISAIQATLDRVALGLLEDHT